jgi:hypothetical protein
MNTTATNTILISAAFTGGTFKAVEGTLVELSLPPDFLQWEFVLHRHLGKAGGWTITERSTGIALKHGTSRTKLLEETAAALYQFTAERFEAKIVALPFAPPPHTLQPATLPVKKAAESTGLDPSAIAIKIAEIAQLTPAEHNAVLASLASTGKNKGRLTAKPKPGYRFPLENAAWNAIQPNGYKVQIGNLFFLRGEAKALYEKLSAHKWPLWLDPDAHALDQLGVW